MPILQASRHCKRCGRVTLHSRSTFSDTLGCLLTVFTVGLFLPIWIVVKIFEALTTAWRCQVCGGARIT